MLDVTTPVGTAEKPSAKRGRIENLRMFEPGKSGNPRGRPKKDLDLAAMAQKHAALAVQTLAQCLTDPDANWPSKVSAASELLDRGFGRAPQSLNVEHKLGLSEEFEAFIRQLSGKPSNVIEVQAQEISNVSPESPSRHLACEAE